MKEKMNVFLSSIHMASKLFDYYNVKALSNELKDLLKETKDVFYEHEKSITKIIEKLGEDPTDDIMVMQKISIKFEQAHLLMVDNDFDLSINVIEGINMGIVASLTFLHDNKKELDKKFIKEAISVIEDYDNSLVKFKKYATNNY